jgi:hypothetical protein
VTKYHESLPLERISPTRKSTTSSSPTTTATRHTAKSLWSGCEREATTSATTHHIEQHGWIDVHGAALHTSKAATAEHVLGILKIDTRVVALSLAINVLE